jgi:hypothetical protein
MAMIFPKVDMICNYYDEKWGIKGVKITGKMLLEKIIS